MTRPTRSLLALTVAVALAAALTACRKSGAGTAKKDAAPPVPTPTVVAAEADTPELLVLTGSIIPDESSDVASDIAGKVVSVMVERGDTVKAGDPLIRLDTRNAQLGAREANANLAAARAQRQLAQDECGRAQALFDKGAITKSQYEREQTSCTAALQQVAAAEARTQMITKSIADGIVRAPFAGTVSDRWIAPGEWVAPGVRLVTLVDADPLKVELTVAESAVPRIALDQKIEVEAVAYPGKAFPGTLTRMGAEIGRQTRALTVEATLEPGSSLVPGMFVEARIVVGSRKLPAVPATAVVKRGQTWRAFAVVKDHLEERVVQLGPPPAEGQVSIIKGVAAGDVLAATVDDKTQDGTRVQPTGQVALPAPAPGPAIDTAATPPAPTPAPVAVPQER